ncbi:MAG TPA: cytochrome c [Polyangium sp.]|nr:cytochrome c [Polyangium sp.]
MNRWSIVAAMGIAAVVGCSEKHSTTESTTVVPPPPSASATGAKYQPLAPNGLSETELDEYHHLPEGGELLPLDMLYAVESAQTFKPFIENLERFGLIPDPRDPDRLPIGMSATLVNGQRAEPRMVFFNCAACHTAEITYAGKTLRVEGAAAHFNMAGFVAELLESFNATLVDPRKLAGFLERLAQRNAQEVEKAYPDLKYDKKKSLAEHLKQVRFPKPNVLKQVDKLNFRVKSAAEAVELLQGKIKYLETLRGLRPTVIPGFGRLDAFMGARNLMFGEKYAHDLNSPVSLPPIYGLSKLSWYHYDNNTTSIVQRNLGEALGVGAVADLATGDSTAELRHLLRLEALASKIPIPKWPGELFGAINGEQATRGETIYKKQCAGCHDYGEDGVFPDRLFDLDKIGTDPNRASSFAEQIGDKTFAESLHGVLDLVQKKAMEHEGISAADIANAEKGPVQWRSTKKYASRPLAGIWASSPYLHNGSVPTLYDLLLPPDKRPKSFQTGSREFDPKKVGYVSDGTLGGSFQLDTTKDGNHNTGHTYGTELTEDQRLDLLEYLKGL